MTVISLSSIPPRFATLGKILGSLLDQSADITEVRLNVPRAYRRFPEDSFAMPDVPEGVRLVVVDHDDGPATKVLPTLKDHAGTSMPIIFCDDDRVVHRDWAKNLLAASARRPDMCIANSGFDVDTIGVHPIRPRGEIRAKPMPSILDLPYKVQRLQQLVGNLVRKEKALKPHRVNNFRPEGFVDIFEGCSGVLVKPGFLAEAVFDVPDRVWAQDDVWMSGMAEAGGTRIWANNGYQPRAIRDAEVEALFDARIDEMNRSEVNLYIVRYLQREYGIWPEAEPEA